MADPSYFGLDIEAVCVSTLLTLSHQAHQS